MQSGSPATLIGIVGASGAGKTTLARALVAALQEAVVVPMDAYYRDLSHLDTEARTHRNFDAPEAFEWPLFVNDLQTLRRGGDIKRPSYDFTAHTRRPETIPVAARPFVIAEGLFLLCRREVRALFDVTVFLDVDEPTAINRRVARDGRERGRDEVSVRTQYAHQVQPMFVRHVLPTRQWATLTLSGQAPVALGVESLLAHLNLGHGLFGHRRVPTA